ncbi:uncharacterized protein LOC121514833 [Cheilinus undulatus]|uniref:uncharacterized protein LOC121514833 n=1 Tax=Cheilinus undulatus TaxID=241271 RepID=UPI001BD285B3|nr:uncharacterized protein LOC121514833 [Cheilinus undulatus]
MFNWVVKVVPQPPEAPGTEENAKAPVANHIKNKDAKNTDEGSEDSQTQTGVLGWLSNGFVSALPQPTGTPRLSRSNSDASGEGGERPGVIGWVSQGLNKMLPQPDDKYKEVDNEEHTEIYDVETMPDYDPLPHIPVVEMHSDDEDDIEDLTPKFPNVVNWIRQMVPQPQMLPPGAVPIEPSNKATKSTRSSLDKIFSPPPESLSGISLDTDSKSSGVVGWFVSGFGLKLPQPALPAKDEPQGAAEILQKVSSKLKPDMVLEDVDSDNEGQQTCTDHTRNNRNLQSNNQETQYQSIPSSNAVPISQPSQIVSKNAREDAETQTGRWTPFIQSIKKEAEDVAMATMEERLLLERMEFARMAEEVARQTAEMAIRQMASEAQSIKLSLGSQELLDEPEVELPVTPEEESEEEHIKITEEEQSLAEEEQQEKSEEPIISETGHFLNFTSHPEPVIAPELKAKPEREPEPETNNKEANAEAEPVTQQPKKAKADGQSPDSDKASEKDGEATEEGCGAGAPVSCDAFKSCLMRIPHTSECLGNINAYFKENGISAPKIPPMPELPRQLSDVTKHLPSLPSLPPELRQELSQIRLTQVPRNIAQTLTELMPKNPDEDLPGPNQNAAVLQQHTEPP